MKFSYYLTPDSSFNIRYVDGVFAQICFNPKIHTPAEYWKAMLSAPVASSNQEALREKVKSCTLATYSRPVSRLKYGVPDDVELYEPGEVGEPATFSDKFSFWRYETGMSQARLAERTGIPRRTIESWESGTNTPPEWNQRLILADIRKLAVKEG